MATTETWHGLTLDARGYLADLECDRYHTGSHRLAPAGHSAVECSGCANFFGPGDLATPAPASAPYGGSGVRRTR